jgi:hypothetical protein
MIQYKSMDKDKKFKVHDWFFYFHEDNDFKKKKIFLNCFLFPLDRNGTFDVKGWNKIVQVSLFSTKNCAVSNQRSIKKKCERICLNILLLNFVQCLKLTRTNKEGAKMTIESIKMAQHGKIEYFIIVVFPCCAFFLFFC